ncbi:hypothetical protein [Streptomyces carpinensis]|uniref:Uncharacterized protein n=1 Tax=Streptomyces carpinensis TaxID=66369 RepID=A0ABV1W3F8_9ACTN|nr:hypothetical protein [Streptomyces carpinensis]
MGIRDFVRSLRPGDDRALAAEQYAGRESASDRAARLRRERHRSKCAQRAARQGQTWEDKDRAKDRKGCQRITY